MTVSVKPDTTQGTDRTFHFSLFNATGAPVIIGLAKGTITEDDARPSLAITDSTVTEGNAEQSTMTLEVTLSAPVATPVTVDFATKDGSATLADYANTSGTLTFEPGTTKRTIEPMAFARTGGRRYLLAWCRLRRAGRWFLLARVRRAMDQVADFSKLEG